MQLRSLHADIHLSFHSTYVNNPEVDLKFTYDIDGLVLELRSAQGLQSNLHYLLQIHQLKDSWYFLKKHLDLSQSSPNGLKAWKNSVGFNIAHVVATTSC